MPAAIETRGLTKDFGQGRGIFDLDLDIQPGRVHGFLGPNGAGKTTTIRLLLDYLRPTRGTCRILGLDCRRQALEIRRDLGFVPGDLELPGHLSGREFLDESASLSGRVKASWRAQLVRAVAAQLEPKIRTLSKGNKQKIALIDALQHWPKILIMDEPTDGLDPLLRHRVQRLLRLHARAGGTVFFSSHVVHEIETTCDEVHIVIAGRLRRSASVRDLLAAQPTRIEATVPDPAVAVERLRAAGQDNVSRRGERIYFELRGDILAPMQIFADLHATDVRVREPDLEQTFLRLYGGVEQA